MKNIPCPDEETIACFIENRLPEGERREVEEYLEECTRCKEILEMALKIWRKENKGEVLEAPKDLIKKIKDLIK